MAHERVETVVAGRRELLDAHAGRGPERARTRAGALGAVVRVGVRMQRRSLQEIVQGGGRPGLLAAGDRVTAAEAAGGRTERALDRGDDAALHAAGVGDHRPSAAACARASPTSGAIVPTGVATTTRSTSRLARAGSRSARSMAPRRRATRRFSAERPSPTISPTDAALAERETERRADQADAGDQQPVGDRFHGDAASRTAASDSAKRWFSAGVPTVTRKWRGKP